jgi:hypothetical protein
MMHIHQPMREITKPGDRYRSYEPEGPPMLTPRERGHTCVFDESIGPLRPCVACRRERQRVRVRARCIDYRGWHYRRDRFPQGDVIRIWLGLLLITIMVKRT